jgi:hypothetical protein
MAHHYPDILLTGYADSIGAVRAELGSYPGELYEANEHTTGLSGEWDGVVVCYVVSFDTASSSQLRSVFAYLHERLHPRHEVVVLMQGVSSEVILFPELDDAQRIPLDGLTAHLLNLGRVPRE